jgi:hypothetical protein
LALVVGLFLGAGVVAAQTGALSAQSDSREIVPVTGPSSAPVVAEAGRPELIPAAAQTATSQTPHKGKTGHVASTGHANAHTTKVVHKHGHGATKTVKKAPPNHVAKTTPKTKHVATAKHQPAAAHQATVGKPIPVTKHPAPANGGSQAQPVLPRV